MPPYNNAPGQNAPVQKLEPANPQAGNFGYAYGSKNQSTPDTYMAVTGSSCTSNVVTLTVAVKEGNIPAVGSTLYIYQTKGTSGAFNDTSGTITIASVNINSATGIGTITYAKTASNQSQAADSGYCVAKVLEIAEALATGKSVQFAIQGLGLTWDYTCPSQPAAIGIQLEGAINDVDAEYAIIGSSVTTVAGATTIAQLPNLVKFVRLHVTAASGGTNPTIVARIQTS